MYFRSLPALFLLLSVSFLFGCENSKQLTEMEYRRKGGTGLGEKEGILAPFCKLLMFKF